MVAAADELGVTHGAVSKQIGMLERLLGRPLLERTANGARPTAEGVAYAAELREALDRISRASRRLFDGPDASEPLRVLAPATFAMQWLLPNLRRAEPAFEDRIAIHTTQTSEPWTKLPFDVAIRRGIDDCAGHRSEALLTEQLTLIAAPTIALRLREQGLDALADVPLVESESRPGELQSWLAKAGVNLSSLKTSRRFSHFYVMLQAIINEYGAGIGSPQILRDEFAAGRIEAPFPDFATPGVEYRLVYKDVAQHPLTREFVTWLLNKPSA